MKNYNILITILFLYVQPTWAEDHNDLLPVAPMISGFEIDNAANKFNVSGEFSSCELPEVTLNAFNGEIITPTCTYDILDNHDQLSCQLPIPYPNIATLPTQKKSSPLLMNVLVSNENISIFIEQGRRGKGFGFVTFADSKAARETPSSIEFQDLKLKVLKGNLEVSFEHTLIAHELTHVVQQRSGDVNRPVIRGVTFNLQFPCANM